MHLSTPSHTNTVQADEAVPAGRRGEVLGGSVHPRLPVSLDPSGLHAATHVDVSRGTSLRLYTDTRDTGLAERHTSLPGGKQ